MNKTAEILKNIPEDYFYNKVNLHIHTNISDGTLTPAEVVKQASEIGLEIISITDHNSAEAHSLIADNIPEGLTVISGVEFDCWHNHILLHIIGYGVDVTNEKLLETCAHNYIGKTADVIRFFNRRNAKDVISIIKEAGGVAVIAHPACCWVKDMEKLIDELIEMGLDGVEAFYPYASHRKIVKFHSGQTVYEIAKRKNLILTGGTDCHSSNLLER